MPQYKGELQSLPVNIILAIRNIFWGEIEFCSNCSNVSGEEEEKLYKIDTRIVPTTTFAQLYKTFWGLA